MLTTPRERAQRTRQNPASRGQGRLAHDCLPARFSSALSGSNRRARRAEVQLGGRDQRRDRARLGAARLPRQAQRSRAPIQKLADSVSAWFVPVVVVVAVITAAAWAIFGPAPAYAYAMVNAVAVLIIACPCALGLATPMSIMVATGRGAQSGILIRNAEALEVMEKIDTLVLDKTGTLTEGKPKLVTVFAESGFDEKEVLSYAASLEKGS